MVFHVEHAPLNPTHSLQGFETRPGNPLPFGASLVPGGVNFSIYSYNATACTLVLFKKGEFNPFAEIDIPKEYRIGSVFPVIVKGLDWQNLEYGFRMDGPSEPEQGHRFNRDFVLLDPYAKSVGGREVWGTTPNYDNIYQHRARIIPPDDFDWGLDRPLETPIEDLIIYELHVRGFTRHPSSGVQFPGTYDSMREKIGYLKALGVNAVELMPIFEFDEFENSRIHPETGELLLNYWGYAPVTFFAPKMGYAASAMRGGEMNELKTLVKELHANGIEVILDVVFNHTAEGNERGHTISFKGIDNSTYYILTPEGYYYNFSGTGNTFNCNHPSVRRYILDCLRYWVAEYHVDGFRFDLASIMTRDENGVPLADPPVLREMAFDPILGKTKLIAEPWDADGLYHLGSFPAYRRWSEWNGYYRDTMRKFLKGNPGELSNVANAVLGSPNLYIGRGPIATINFITAHDGFTLRDLVSYNEKHNEANGEENRDGANDNNSWNSGVEGETDDPQILALRRRRVKNFLTVLMMSQGVPMLLMGDEMGRTQYGNNNAYSQDNEMNWLDWGLLEENRDLFEFTRAVIEFRRRHPVLRGGHFLRGQDYNNKGCPDITWYGVRGVQPNWGKDNRALAFLLCGDYAKGGLWKDDHVYVAMNMFWEDRTFNVPPAPHGAKWHLFVNTSSDKQSVYYPGTEPLMTDQTKVRLKSYSVAVLLGRELEE
jgi:isoamylase